MSNILAVFNPPPQRELEKEETMDCIPCQVMSTMFSVGFGSYLASGKPFKYGKKEAKRGISLTEFEKRNPQWWKVTLRSFGGLLIAFGFVRGTEGWLWHKNKEYKNYKKLSNDGETQAN
ncbi:AEL_HP2_G0006070.mRNA.1.CDS.1 [Saccharomyces cerevisiae]|nr:AEL_HP2_G0006070.mRNA.1.CDS.1 [Saccharomyces cerevisiae]CAI6414141.1 AEL_HP2_G0006070.mRNA.1.CDS.1 [Saccharomyces cerevisiae]CAI6420723.1 AEL_HP1_G0007320.mRNA.1.CDS.1 [Saccharomyces cerevisiae]